MNDRDKKILKARVKVSSDKLAHTMMVELEGAEKEIQTFFWYPDEIHISANEVIGLTLQQAYDLKHQKDVAYIRS